MKPTALLPMFALVVSARVALATSPTIHVTWSGGTPQIPDDYAIITSNPDFPISF